MMSHLGNVSPMVPQRLELSGALRGPAALVLVAGISMLDYVSGPDLSFSLFYFAVLAFYAWTGATTRATICTACAIGGIWLVAEWYTMDAPHAAILLWNAAMRLVVLVGLGVVVCRLRRALLNEQALARTDFLTGALNARAFAERAQREISRARRYGHALTVAYIDLDDFKRVNDRFGHSYGDEVLRTVARAIQSHLRDTDSLARVGGDEFVVLLPETSAEQGERVLSKLQFVVAESMTGREAGVTFSIGAVAFDPPPPDVDAVIKASDAAMYGAKRDGKNRVHVHSDGPPTGVPTRAA